MFIVADKHVLIGCDQYELNICFLQPSKISRKSLNAVDNSEGGAISSPIIFYAYVSLLLR